MKSEVVTRWIPSGLKLVFLTKPKPEDLMVAFGRHCPSTAPQILSVPSREINTRRFPSGLKLAPFTELECLMVIFSCQ